MSPLMKTYKADLILDAKATLGEGPLWDAERNCLWWVDILPGKLHRFNVADGTNETFAMGQMLGTVGLCESARLIVALEHGFAFFDPATGAIDLITDPESDKPDNRFNDGKPGPDGAFWAGSMEKALTRSVGAFWRLSPEQQATKVMGDVGCSNGIAWNDSATTMYYVDSLPNVVYAFDFDAATGAATNQRVALKFDASLGSADGMTIDRENMLWIAHWDGYSVRRWNPETGELLAQIDLPVARVTCPVFGGPNLSTLYITTAKTEGGADGIDSEPTSGGVFSAELDIAGYNPYRYHA